MEPWQFTMGRHRSISSPGYMDHSILAMYQNVEIPSTPDNFPLYPSSAPASPPLISWDMPPAYRRMSASYPQIAPRPRPVREAVLHSKTLGVNPQSQAAVPGPKMEFFASRKSSVRVPKAEELPLPPDEWLSEGSTTSGSETASSSSGLLSRQEETGDHQVTHIVMQEHAQFLTVSLKMLLKMSA